MLKYFISFLTVAIAFVFENMLLKKLLICVSIICTGYPLLLKKVFRIFTSSDNLLYMRTKGDMSGIARFYGINFEHLASDLNSNSEKVGFR